MTGRNRSVFFFVAVAIVASSLAPSVAQAAPIDDKKAQAASLQQQIDENGERISALSEQYNEANIKLDAANAAIADAEARLKAAQDQADHTRGQVSQRAAALYRGASGTAILPTDDVENFNEMSLRSKYGALATDRDENLIAKLERTQEDLTFERTALDARKADAEAVVASIASARKEIEAANAKQQRLLSQVKGEIATLVRQEQQRRDAAARAAALARIASAESNTSGGGGNGNGGGGASARAGNRDLAPNIPAPSSRAQIAIDYALAQVGKPYRYAGVGPDAYDCSGLTMMAWAQAGVSMPHASSGQYAMFPHIPFEQIQPGDLIVWGPGGNRHVAMYLGNGMQVAATHTGDFVKVQPVYGGWWGVARPG
jgi:cell wall-associated NlpC family hydrolase